MGYVVRSCLKEQNKPLHFAAVINEPWNLGLTYCKVSVFFLLRDQHWLVVEMQNSIQEPRLVVSGVCSVLLEP